MILQNGHSNGGTGETAIDHSGTQPEREHLNGDQVDGVEASASDEDDEDDDEEEEEEEEEPALKYERLGGSAHELLEKDSASALAVSSQLLVSYYPLAREIMLTSLLGHGDP